MTFVQVAITAPIVAAVGIFVICKWIDRRHEPMPPLKRRVPGLPVDGEELTEREKTILIRVLIDTRHCDVPEPEYER